MRVALPTWQPNGSAGWVGAVVPPAVSARARYFSPPRPSSCSQCGSWLAAGSLPARPRVLLQGKLLRDRLDGKG